MLQNFEIFLKPLPSMGFMHSGDGRLTPLNGVSIRGEPPLGSAPVVVGVARFRIPVGAQHEVGFDADHLFFCTLGPVAQHQRSPRVGALNVAQFPREFRLDTVGESVPPQRAKAAALRDEGDGGGVTAPLAEFC